MKKIYLCNTLILFSVTVSFGAGTLYASAFPEDSFYEKEQSRKRQRAPHENLDTLDASGDAEQDSVVSFETQHQHTNKKLRTRGVPSGLLDASACRLMMQNSRCLSENMLTPLKARLEHAEKAKAYGEAVLARNKTLVLNDALNLANFYFDQQDLSQATSLYEELSSLDNSVFSLEHNRQRAYLLYRDGDFEEAAELYYYVVASQAVPMIEDYTWAILVYDAMLDELGDESNIDQRMMYQQRIEEMTKAREILFDQSGEESL